MALRRWIGLLICSLLLLTGCSASRGAKADPAPATGSDGVLTSGRYTTKQGTMRYLREFTLQADGKVLEVQTVLSTDRFADLWRDRFPALSQSMTEYTLSKEEKSEQFSIRATKLHASLDAFNETGIAQVKRLNSPLFHAIDFKTETGPYDSDTMIQRFGNAEQATAEDWIGFLKNAVTVEFVVTDEETGKTYTWDRTAGQIGAGVPVTITGKQWNRLAYYGAGGVGVFLLFVLYMGLFGRRLWDNRDTE